MIDLLSLAQEYGLFVALVAFVIWEGRNRETRYRERESVFIDETREREKRYIERENKYIEQERKYVEREDKYISVIEGLSDSIEKMSADITTIRERIEKRRESFGGNADERY